MWWTVFHDLFYLTGEPRNFRSWDQDSSSIKLHSGGFSNAVTGVEASAKSLPTLIIGGDKIPKIGS